MTAIILRNLSNLNFATVGTSFSHHSRLNQNPAQTSAQFRRPSLFCAFLLIMLCFCLPAAMFAATASSPATLISPTSGSKLPGSSATFTWTAGTGVQAYAIWVGTAGPVTRDVFDSGVVSLTSMTVPTLPASGTVYVTLYSEINGVFQPTSYTFSAAAPSATASVASPATLVSPTPGSKLPSSSATFTWTAGKGVQAYAIWVGTTGASTRNIFDSGVVSFTSITVPNLPTSGTVCVTLYSEINGVFQPTSYTFNAATSSSTVAAALTSPAAGSKLSGSATFNWTAGTGVQAYAIWIGTAGPVTRDVFDSGVVSLTSITVPTLPASGTVYVTLYSEINGTFQPTSYTFTAGSTTSSLASLSCSSASITGSGTDACTVSLTSAAATSTTVSLSSSNSSVTMPASITIAAGATTASFTATVSAVSAAQAVTLRATAGSISQSFALQLKINTPTLSINATSVAFGAVTVNTPATQTVVLTSTGGSAVNVSSVTVTGTGFNVSGATFPMTLNPGQTVTLSIVFAPASAGAVTGQLIVNSSSSTNGSAAVSLSGTGASIPYEVNLTWNAPVSTSDPVVSYNVYRSPSGSSSYQLVNASSLVACVDSTVQSGQAYNYIIMSVDAAGNQSTGSNMASVIIP